MVADHPSRRPLSERMEGTSVCMVSVVGARAPDVDALPLALAGVAIVLVADDGVDRVEGGHRDVRCGPRLKLHRRLHGERGARAPDVDALALAGRSALAR